MPGAGRRRAPRTPTLSRAPFPDGPRDLAVRLTRRSMRQVRARGDAGQDGRLPPNTPAPTVKYVEKPGLHPLSHEKSLGELMTSG